MSRETFGKKLVHHQIIRFKLAEMARQIEALHDNIERVAFQVLLIIVIIINSFFFALLL
jgi:alkylation response protein AidB-like acyl-CoA dehydrogenase